MDSINYNNFPQLSSELFCVFNQDGYAFEFNQAWYTKLGYDLDKILGLGYTKFIHHEDLDKTIEAISKLPELKVINNFEIRYLTSDGNVLHLSWNATFNENDGLMYGYARDITKTKENEYFLLKSSQLAKIGGWKFNLSSRKLDWTDETFKIHELSKEEGISLSKALTYYSKSHKKIIFKVFRDCFKGHSFSVNLKIHLKNSNRYKWVRINGEPQFFNSKLRFIQGTYQDINDEMINKIKLIESEERYRFALEASNDFIWDWDIATNKVYFSDELAKSLGYSVSDFDQNLFLEIMYPGDKDKMISKVFEYLDGKTDFETEFRLKTIDGIYRWFRSKGKALFDQDKKPFRMSGSFTDITNKKKKESQLKSALQTAVAYQFALNKVSIVISVDCEGKIYSVNDQFTKTTGYTIEDIKGKDIFFIFGKAYKKTVVDKIWSSLQQGITWEGTLKNKTKEDKDFWVDMYAVPLTQAVDNICYMFIAHDKTNEVQIMEELEEERIKTLQTSKLAAIGEMAGGIAHEINNPLAIIHGYASNMKTMIENNDLDSSKLLVNKIVNTTDRIAKIIKSLKTFSRSSEHDSFQKVNFIEIMNDTLTFCYEKLKRNNIELRVEKPSETCMVMCRQVEIAQVFLNLVNNSCDALELADKKILNIKIKYLSDAELMISVIDTGSGIDHTIKEKILNPFFTTKDVGKGTGLGLSISKKIIDSHNGELNFKSKPGHTEFYFTLPRAVELEEIEGSNE